MTRFRIMRFADGTADDPIIDTIEITRETEKCYWTKGSRPGSEIKHVGTAEPIYKTFDEAKAEHTRQRRDAVVIIKDRINSLHNSLVKAEALLAAAPLIGPPHA
jgi:hypothetical protein